MGVLHYEAEFDLIAAVTGQSGRWVLPAGGMGKCVGVFGVYTIKAISPEKGYKLHWWIRS